MPAFALYPIGITRNGSFHLTAITSAFGACVAVICIASLAATLLNRYLLTFHTKLPKFLIVILSFVGFAAVLLGKYLFTFDPSYYLQAAVNYDPCMATFVTEEPGFIFISQTEVTDFVVLALLIVEVFIIACGIILVIIFIYLVKSQKSQTLEKLQRSLIVSALVQLSLTGFLLMLPFSLIYIFLYFKISNTANFTVILLCIIFSHSFFESVVTLYFVIPYRKGVAEILAKHFSYFDKNRLSKSVVQIPPIIVPTDIPFNLSRIEIR